MYFLVNLMFTIHYPDHVWCVLDVFPPRVLNVTLFDFELGRYLYVVSLQFSFLHETIPY